MPHFRKGFVVTLACALITAGLAPQTGGAAEPFTIDVILPQTGPASFLGKEEGEALGVIETLTNRAGGIGGRPIHFAILDDQSSPQVAVQQFNTILAHHPAVVLGPSVTATCSAIAPLAENAGPVVYCLSPGVHPASGSYVFSAAPSTADLLAVAERYAHQRGWTKIASLTSTDATGQDAENGINAAFLAPGAGEAIVDREHFNISDVSVDAQMARIKSSGAQVLVAWTTGTPFATVLRGASDIGLTIPMITASGNITYSQMTAYASFMYDPLYFDGFPYVDPAHVGDRAVKRAVDSYIEALTSHGVRPDIGQPLAWDPTLIVLDAFRHLGLNATAKQLRDYITGSGFVGAFGRYDFRRTPQRGLDASNIVVCRWDAKNVGSVAVSRPGGAPMAR